MSAIERSREVVELLSYMQDKDERLQFVIDKGKGVDGLPEELKRDEFRIEGCQSQLWLVPEFRDGRCYFSADSDAVITRGIANLLVEVYSGAEPQEVLDLDPEFLAEAGITQHLTPNRRNGLTNLTSVIQRHAKACL